MIQMIQMINNNWLYIQYYLRKLLLHIASLNSRDTKLVE